MKKSSVLSLSGCCPLLSRPQSWRTISTTERSGALTRSSRVSSAFGPFGALSSGPITTRIPHTSTIRIRSITPRRWHRSLRGLIRRPRSSVKWCSQPASTFCKATGGIPTDGSGFRPSRTPHRWRPRRPCLQCRAHRSSLIPCRPALPSGSITGPTSTASRTGRTTQRPFQRSTAARRTATARPDFRPRMSDVLFMGDVQGCGAGAARPAESRGIRSGAASPRAPQ